jgi:hypothetical protein
MLLLAGCVGGGQSGGAASTTKVTPNATTTPTPTTATSASTVTTGYYDCPAVLRVERANVSELDHDDWTFVQYATLSDREQDAFRDAVAEGEAELDDGEHLAGTVVAYEGANYTVNVDIC